MISVQIALRSVQLPILITRVDLYRARVARTYGTTVVDGTD